MSGVDGMRVAVLGLGIIGSRAVARLADAGWRLACWNRTPKGLVGECESPEEAVAGAQVVSIYLKDGLAVRSVVSQVLPSLAEGAVVMNHATVDLATTLWLERAVVEAGGMFLDVPFTGSRVAAEGGKLVYYIGGDPALAEEFSGYLEVTSRATLVCGGVGSATVVKLATNLISACSVQALAEAMAIATRHGVAADCFIGAVMENASGSVLAGMKLPTMAAGDFDTHFSLDNMRKDSAYAIELAAQAGLVTPAIEAVSRRMAELCAEGMADLDYSALAKPYLAEEL